MYYQRYILKRILILKKENERLRGIVNDYDQWVRKLNGQYQKKYR